MSDFSEGRTREQSSAIARRYGAYAKVAFPKQDELAIAEEKRKREILRKQGLAKLSPDERTALGIQPEGEET
jgi:hypothetical protein